MWASKGLEFHFLPETTKITVVETISKKSHFNLNEDASEARIRVFRLFFRLKWQPNNEFMRHFLKFFTTVFLRRGARSCFENQATMNEKAMCRVEIQMILCIQSVSNVMTMLSQDFGSMIVWHCHSASSFRPSLCVHKIHSGQGRI